MSDPLVSALAKLRETQQEHAIGAMNYPRKKRFDHGVEIGIHQGLQLAIEIVEATLKDDEDEAT